MSSEQSSEESVAVSTQAQPLDPAAQSASEFAADGCFTGQALKAYGSQLRRHEDERILQYLPLVQRIVSQVVSYLQPPLSREDLISAGTIGLVKAARDYDSSRDAEFKTYAYIRIRGAVIDELRGWSFAPPSVKKMIDSAQEWSQRIMNERGSLPDDDELASRMHLEPQKLIQVFETARARHFLSIHGLDDSGPVLGGLLAASAPGPQSAVEQKELKLHLARAMRSLPEKQRQIVLLYYHRELTMKQIAEVMELTESRISQLHAAALFKLSVLMKQWNDASPDERKGI
ncbi:MAG: sigma-70 family RNA polymerase sigma factor [Planctomycetaceae bacterium]|nr:sigma-70 family RNA polymerase sigma factor [Planctomycetaceae bacterium]